MNDLDRKIIALLRENARITVSELASRTDVSRVTIQKRINMLESSGEISGYTVVLRKREDTRIRGWMSIAVEGNKSQMIIQALRGEPSVSTLHTTNGRWDILVELQSDTLNQFDNLLGWIRRIPGISHTETSILLSTRKTEQ